jgi:hypothetical protein
MAMRAGACCASGSVEPGAYATRVRRVSPHRLASAATAASKASEPRQPRMAQPLAGLRRLSDLEAVVDQQRRLGPSAP